MTTTPTFLTLKITFSLMSCGRPTFDMEANVCRQDMFLSMVTSLFKGYTYYLVFQLHAAQWLASKRYAQSTHAVILAESSNILQKMESGMGCVNWNTAMHSLWLRILLWIYCPGHAGVSKNERADRLASTANITSGMQLGRAEVLRCLRNFLNMDRPEHHSIDHLKEREVEKGSGQLSTLCGPERSVFNQSNGVSRTTLGRLLVECVWAFSNPTLSSSVETETAVAKFHPSAASLCCYLAAHSPSAASLCCYLAVDSPSAASPCCYLAPDSPSAASLCCYLAAHSPSAASRCCYLAADSPSAASLCCYLAADSPSAASLCCYLAADSLGCLACTCK